VSQLAQAAQQSKRDLELFKGQVASAENSWLPLWLQVSAVEYGRAVGGGRQR
jgi:hypothetical protein